MVSLQQFTPLAGVLACRGLAKTASKMFFRAFGAVFETPPKSHENWTFGGGFLTIASKSSILVTFRWGFKMIAPKCVF